MQVILYAQPYDITAMGFSFSDIEGYRTKAAALRNAASDPVEEFEIQFIEGDAIDTELFAALSISQARLDGFLPRQRTGTTFRRPKRFSLAEMVVPGLIPPPTIRMISTSISIGSRACGRWLSSLWRTGFLVPFPLR